jgi:hypothetical protein
MRPIHALHCELNPSVAHAVPASNAADFRELRALSLAP